MTIDNPPPENPLTHEQRRALAEVYRFLISLNRHESQEARKPTSAADNHIDEATIEIPKEAITEKSENVSPLIAQTPKDGPVIDQKEVHRTESSKDFSDNTLTRSVNHPGQPLDS